MSIQKDDLAELLMRLVKISSKSRDVDGNNMMVSEMATLFTSLGMEVKRVPNQQYGDCLIAETTAVSSSEDEAITLIGHTDTALSVRDWLKRGKQIEISGDRLRGPGSCDMKSGLVQIYFALKELKKENRLHDLPLRVFLVPDEEIASPSSSVLTGQLGSKSSAILVFEFGRQVEGKDVIVTSRRGRAQFELTFIGEEAHAGKEPDRSKNAIAGMWAFNSAIASVADMLTSYGGSLNEGGVEGGSREKNILRAARCSVNFELRSPTSFPLITAEQMLTYQAKNHAWPTKLKKISFAKALEETSETSVLFSKYQKACSEVGLKMFQTPKFISLSSANYAQAPGVPLIDALGAYGLEVHTEYEWVSLSDLHKKTLATAKFLENSIRKS